MSKCRVYIVCEHHKWMTKLKCTLQNITVFLKSKEANNYCNMNINMITANIYSSFFDLLAKIQSRHTNKSNLTKVKIIITFCDHCIRSHIKIALECKQEIKMARPNFLGEIEALNL